MSKVAIVSISSITILMGGSTRLEIGASTESLEIDKDCIVDGARPKASSNVVKTRRTVLRTTVEVMGTVGSTCDIDFKNLAKYLKLCI